MQGVSVISHYRRKIFDFRAERMDDNNDEIILNQLNSLPPSKELLQQYQVEKDQKKNILNFIFISHKLCFTITVTITNL